MGDEFDTRDDELVTLLCERAPALRQLLGPKLRDLCEPRIAGAMLEDISLSYYRCLQDSAVSNLVASCPRLRRLDISGCGDLREPTLVKPNGDPLDLVEYTGTKLPSHVRAQVPEANRNYSRRRGGTPMVVIMLGGNPCFKAPSRGQDLVSRGF